MQPGREYRWEGRPVRVSSLFATTEGAWACVREVPGALRRNVPADELGPAAELLAEPCRQHVVAVTDDGWDPAQQRRLEQGELPL